MDESWGISGPDFTVLYLVLVALGIAGFFLVRAVRARAGGTADSALSSPFELAYLAGGPVRVAESTLAGLVERGSVRVDRAGHVSAADSAELADPLLRRALTEIEAGRQHRVHTDDQARLLNALLADGPVPEGFDRDRLRAQREALIAKRRDLLRMAHPELVEQAGERFVEYARRYPGRPQGGTHADAMRLAEWLAEREPESPKRRWRHRPTRPSAG